MLTLRDEDIHIGDVLRIRAWDDMAREYDCISDHAIDISTTSSFVGGMRYMCGQTFTVKDKISSGCNIRYSSIENIEYCRDINGEWHITADMLEPNEDNDEDNDICVASDEELDTFCEIYKT